VVLGIAILLACVGLSGCAAIVPSSNSTSRKERSQREPDLSAFEQKRDDAQFVAARERIEQGDFDAAETLLKSLLDRSPGHLESRLLLADLCVSQDRTAEAEVQLRQVLQRSPDHARAHHSLGLLCDITGRAEEAAEHFRQAAESAPHEEAYRLSLEASITPPRR
jgi:Tfp pilus assembly protein PilF